MRQLVGDMVDIPGGTFRMGDIDGGGVLGFGEPVHSVTVPAFRLGKYEVTFAQWDACAADGGCGGYTPNDRGWGRGNRPVIVVSWDDAQSFIDWLNEKTGGYRRKPSGSMRRVIRGGSWYHTPEFLGSADRLLSDRWRRGGGIGFRLAQDK